MGVERCVNLNGLTEAQIDKKLEELAKARESLNAK
jgi:NADH dehydrogenase (ubiquinone) 1 alpha subcomplex subunit 2